MRTQDSLEEIGCLLLTASESADNPKLLGSGGALSLRHSPPGDLAGIFQLGLQVCRNTGSISMFWLLPCSCSDLHGFKTVLRLWLATLEQ